MKERPILFNTAMVRAVLDGSKTQTRRIVKGFALELLTPNNFTPEYVALPENNLCPYGHPGDQLWVREAWAEVGTMDPGLIVYRADYPACVPSQYENVPSVDAITWKPSIHMFRRYSRITLEIVSVRVERLRDISESDALAEGAPALMPDGKPFAVYTKAAHRYAFLWDSINGSGSWLANPWVWVVEFRRIPR